MKYTISMARFLLLTHIYPPAIDGGSRVITKMGQYLHSKGHQVLVLTSNCYSSDDFASLHPHRIKLDKSDPNIIRLPAITLFHRPFKYIGRYIPSFKTFAKGPIFSPFSFIPSLITILKYRPDFILSGPLPTTIILYARLIRFLSTYLLNYSPKLIINASFHPTDPYFQTPILLRTLKLADFIWNLTDFEYNCFQKKLSIPKSKQILLGNGVDKKFLKNHPPSSKESKRGFNLLFVGSLSAHKDIPTLIKAFSRLPSNFTLTLAGQKTLYFPQIQKQIKSLPSSIKKRINLIFNFTDDYLSTLIDNCFILISPSLQESFGLVLIEAMARSTPVIAANIPASTELITKSKAGLLFKAGSSTDLKNKILKLSSSPKLLNLLSKNGFTYVSTHYTWDKIGKNLCKKLDI